MSANKIPLGQSRFGEGPYKIDDITTNAALLIRAPHKSSQVAAMNFDPYDAINAQDVIAGIISKYMSQFSVDDEVQESDLEAIVVGGEFREHIYKEERGIYVYVEHDINKKMLLSALYVFRQMGRLGRVSYITTDPVNTKTFNIGIGGGYEEPQQEPRGANQYEAVMSLDAYEMTIEIYEE